jgi:hypothetical protein
MINDRNDSQNHISRRRFVAGGVAAGATVAGMGGAQAAEAKTTKPKKKAKPKASTTHKADVVVIGAGMAGMTAARTVKAAGKSVIVLEARGRVGGRCYSRPLQVPGATDVANMGATFVGPTQLQILAESSASTPGRSRLTATQRPWSSSARSCSRRSIKWPRRCRLTALRTPRTPLSGTR